MLRNSNWIAIALTAVLLVVLATGPWSRAAETRYEYQVDTHGIPSYRTEAMHIMDSYERLMDRYMEMVEIQMERSNQRMVGLSRQIEEINVRLARIEKALDIEPMEGQSGPEGKQPGGQ